MSLFKLLFGRNDSGSDEQHPSVSEVFSQLDNLRRKASIAEIGEFPPPVDTLSSWFGGQAVMQHDEAVPQYKGKPMFPILQIKISELPYVPKELNGTALLVVWLNQDEVPFDQPNGEGWLIREYTNLEKLRLVPDLTKPSNLKTLPIKWSISETEGPGWEEAWGLVDLHSVNASEEAADEFFTKYTSHHGTKVGGYPTQIQHELIGNASYVFQIGSEKKANWMWVDNGIAYFLKNESGDWEFECQFY